MFLHEAIGTKLHDVISLTQKFSHRWPCTGNTTEDLILQFRMHHTCPAGCICTTGVLQCCKHRKYHPFDGAQRSKLVRTELLFDNMVQITLTNHKHSMLTSRRFVEAEGARLAQWCCGLTHTGWEHGPNEGGGGVNGAPTANTGSAATMLTYGHLSSKP